MKAYAVLNENGDVMRNKKNGASAIFESRTDAKQVKGTIITCEVILDTK